jgi:hypothetical protein
LLNKGKVIDTAKLQDKGSFKFEKVLPGKYLLKVQMDEFCWEKERFDIDLQEEDIKNI